MVNNPTNTCINKNQQQTVMVNNPTNTCISGIVDVSTKTNNKQWWSTIPLIHVLTKTNNKQWWSTIPLIHVSTKTNFHLWPQTIDNSKKRPHHMEHSVKYAIGTYITTIVVSLNPADDEMYLIKLTGINLLRYSVDQDHKIFARAPEHLQTVAPLAYWHFEYFMCSQLLGHKNICWATKIVILYCSGPSWQLKQNC